MKKYITLFFKGIGVGAANVIPGVSGGTIALITGIFEKLINSIKSFDIKAIKLLFKGKFKEFAQHVNLFFLIAVFGGAVLSIATLAKVLEYLFANYPVYVWSFFFGLILASVYFVGRTISRWNVSVLISFIVGTAIAVAISLMNTASENEAMYYLFICGIVAVCSMILPGLSGSFVLVLMGNYELVMIKAVNEVRLNVLLPVIAGAAFGLLAFSHILSWLYRKFKDQTIAILTGFILGSLAILWPWKDPIYKTDDLGNFITKDSGEYIIQGYQRLMPESFNQEVLLAIAFLIVGIATIWMTEKLAAKKQ
ncbi:MAG: DUF368 domain-containing protein [Bacteroidales bacterium]|nr:DUF368 domain-containing protein [Bacteroidales bacterium]